MRQQLSDLAGRIGGEAKLQSVLLDITAAFEVDPVRHSELINVGYEDCNLAITTNGGSYVAKIFASDREADLPGRTVGNVLAAQAAGVRHPRLLVDRRGEVLRTERTTGLRYFLMERIEGNTFYDLERPPEQAELRRVVAQVVRLHSSDHVPAHLVDPWSVPHLDTLFTEIGPLLRGEDRGLVEPVVAAMAEVETRSLPHALIHGDLTKGNIIVSGTGDVHLIDLASANRWPRVQELGVIAANLMHGSPLSVRERVVLLAELYAEHEPLTVAELRALETYVLASLAMEFLGACREKLVLGDTSEETEYVLELGRTGLHAHAL